MQLPRIVETPDLRKRKKILYIALAFGLALNVARFFVSVHLALNDLLTMLLLFLGIKYLNYCMLVFFIILTLFAMSSYVMLIGIIIQSHTALGEVDINRGERTAFIITLVSVSLIFDIVVCWLCYDNYKILKHKTIYGNVGGLARQVGRGLERAIDNAGNGFEAFGGRGMQIG